MKPAELSQPSQIESAIEHLDSFAAFVNVEFPLSLSEWPLRIISGEKTFSPSSPKGLSFLILL
jgi:hypothetical protein